MKLCISKRQCELNRSISSVWEVIRDISGYSDRRVGNIHKENENTWYFTFYFEKSKFSRLLSPIVSGTAYSSDDRLTRIEIKSGSYLATIVIAVAYIVFILASNFGSGIVPNMVIRVMLLTLLVIMLIFIHNRESRLNVDEFVRKLQLEDNSMDKQYSTEV